MRVSFGLSRAVAPLAAVVSVTLGQVAWAQIPADTPLIGQVERSVPDPAELAKYIRDKTAALKLGKALFWDMQVGSDGLTACATCHFHAGVDSRSKNQISPALKGTPKDITFSEQLGGAPNRQLTLEDFPLHKLSDPNDRASAVLSDTNDVVSSQGVHYGIFLGANTGGGEIIQVEPDPDGFRVGNINVRRVEPRNTPTVINAVLNRILFWDGRAKDTFNGIDPTGNPNTVLYIYKSTGLNQIVPVSVQLAKSPLASLSVGPPLSDFEMSAVDRTFLDIGDRLTRERILKQRHQDLRRYGRNLRGVRPLAKQVIHPHDSVLGTESRSPTPGLRTATYDALIRQAFRPEWWLSSQIIQVNDEGDPTVLFGPVTTSNQYSLMEWNFSLFFGLALQEYMATLVDGDSPFDRFQRGDLTALSPQQINGLTLFVNSATQSPPGVNCDFCHVLPEFTTAARGQTEADAPSRGFRNIGVRPIAEDPGQLDGASPSGGRFKTPTLRNVELTAPYMHNGGMATLKEVIEFYNRGRSDFDDTQGGAAPGTILNLSDAQQEDLIAFLRALTDDRVRFKKAPFDHPQLFVPNGHPLNQSYVRNNSQGNAVDQMLQIPAVGRNGGPSIASKSFLGIQQ